MIRAAAKNHAYAAVVVAPGELRRGARGAARLRRPALDGDAREPRRRGVRGDRSLRHRDRALVRRARSRRVPAAARACLREGRRSLLRREPAPARRLLLARWARARTCSRWSASITASSSPTTTCSTSTRRAACREDLGDDGAAARPSCVIVKHNNPCGCALGESRARRLPAGLRLRPAERLRRCDRAQHPGRPRAGARPSASSSSRCCSRPVTTRTRSRC